MTRIANQVTASLDDATVAVSEDVRTTMGRRAEHTEVIAHGIDVDGVRSHLHERDAVRAELGIGDDELLAVTVANLREKKGYPVLLDAARRVVDAGAPVRFVAAGQGPLEAELRARITELDLGARFGLLGYVPNAARLVAGGDVFVLASQHEGLPLAVMEALALGVPVVATRVGGIPELVEDGTSGLLVPAGRPGCPGRRSHRRHRSRDEGSPCGRRGGAGAAGRWPRRDRPARRALPRACGQTRPPMTNAMVART